MRKRNLIFLILSLLWMATIFYFSSKDADASTEDSYRVGYIVGHIFVHDFSDLSEEKQREFAAKVDHPIRKTAHASEYALLALLLSGAFLKPSRKKLQDEEAGQDAQQNPESWVGVKSQFFCAWICTTLYAATDEFHQTFVPGRSGEPRDVALDSLGALAGILILYLIIHIRSKHIIKKAET